eukprot:SAG31_NODE_43451_length_267_cov_0.613095_1_plen_31_part_10
MRHHGHASIEDALVTYRVGIDIDNRNFSQLD